MSLGSWHPVPSLGWVYLVLITPQLWQNAAPQAPEWGILYWWDHFLVKVVLWFLPPVIHELLGDTLYLNHNRWCLAKGRARLKSSCWFRILEGESSMVSITGLFHICTCSGEPEVASQCGDWKLFCWGLRMWPCKAQDWIVLLLSLDSWDRWPLGFPHLWSQLIIQLSHLGVQEGQAGFK